MRKIDRRIIIVISVIFILGLAWGLMKFLIAQKELAPVRMTMESRRFVMIEPVRYTNISSRVTGPGRLASIAEIDIVSEAAGKIEPGNVPLKKGASFLKGEVLFVVYPDESILSLKARKSQYQNILASILPDLAIDFSEHEQAFLNFFNSISVDKPLPVLPDINDQKLKIFLASRNVISEYYNIQSDQLQLSRRTVKAPFNGTFKEVYMEIGAYTNTGGKVARAIHTDQLELVVPLKRVDAAWVNPGDPVTVQIENRGLSWKGKVLRKSQYIDESTQRQEIFVQIPYDKQQPLMAGEYLMASFPVRPIDHVMEIPRNSVFNSDEVFIVKNNRLSKQKINVIKENERTLIFNGLNEGDSLVVQQLINVSEGTLVTVDKDAPGGGEQMGGGQAPGNPGQQPGKQPKNRKMNQN